MLLKAFGFTAPVVAIGIFASGVLGGGYSREVGRPPAEVMAALADLDITEQPGSPGTDPSRAGGVMPEFRLDRGDDFLTWTVMSGDEVATRMTAIVEPIDGGRHSRVTALVERGDAPDDFVSPAFRSEGLTMSLFGLALEGEINRLTLPKGNPERCRELMAGFEAGAPRRAPGNLTQAIGATAQTAMRLHAMEAELRRNGCDTEGSGEFVSPVSQMGEPGPPPVDGVSFEPGKPMVDPSPH